MVRYTDYITVFRTANGDGTTSFEQSSPKFDPFSEDNIEKIKIYEGDCKVILKGKTSMSGLVSVGDLKVIIPDENVPTLQERDVAVVKMNGGIDGNESQTVSEIETIVNSFVHYEYNSIALLEYKKDGTDDQ